jgi:hypothetical protein
VTSTAPRPVSISDCFAFSKGSLGRRVVGAQSISCSADAVGSASQSRLPITPRTIPFFVHHRADRVAALLRSRAGLANGFGDPACRQFDLRVVHDPKRFRLSILPDRRQSMRQPIGFSRFVVKDYFETETLEPRRGSGSQVSLVVIAMNDCGVFLIQARDGFLAELC